MRWALDDLHPSWPRHPPASPGDIAKLRLRFGPVAHELYELLGVSDGLDASADYLGEGAILFSSQRILSGKDREELVAWLRECGLFEEMIQEAGIETEWWLVLASCPDS